MRVKKENYSTACTLVGGEIPVVPAMLLFAILKWKATDCPENNLTSLLEEVGNESKEEQGRAAWPGTINR